MRILLITLCLLTVSCKKEEYKPAVVLNLNVKAKHRPFVDEKKLGRDALDYSILPGILVELIPESTVIPSKAQNRELIFSSASDPHLFLTMRKGDTLTLTNKTHRPLILESYVLMGYGFPIYLGTDEDNMSRTIEIKQDCRNAVIFDHSDNFKITITVNPYHKAYLRSGEFKLFGLIEGAPLSAGIWKVRLSHPRFPTLEKTISLFPKCPEANFEYSLGPLVTKAGEKGSLPYIP